MSYCEVRYEHFKREDSTNSIIVTLFDDDQVTPIVPNSSHSWSAKVAKEEDEEKYVGEYPVQISGNEIILTSDRLVRLPRGTYLMELWENNNGKVTIYPSADFIQFTIHKNATDTMGHVDPTTDINKIIDDLHKAGQNIKLGTVTTGAPGSSVIIRQRLENGQNLLDFTIPRGDKGDKGDKGDQGERGPQGIQGIQGPQGKTGQTGPVGPAPTLRVGSVTKVAPGGTPTASVTGSNGDYSLNLGVPEGQQGAPGGVLNWTKVDLSTSDYDQNTWYPVVMDTIGASSKFETIAVSRPLNDGWGKPTWSTHSRGFDGVYQYRVIYPFFGAIPPICYIDAEHSYFVSDGKSPVHLDIHANNGGYVLYLRGGSKYEVGYSGNANNWKIFKTDYNFNSVSFSPTTTEPASFDKMRKIWPSVSVINLQMLTKLGGVSEDALLSGLISSVAKANNVLKSPIDWGANDSTKSSPSSGITRFTTKDSKSINMGGYWFYDTSVIVPGKQYLFQTKVRGKNCTLIRAGEQGDTDRGWSVPLDDEWQKINFVFDARRDIVIYASVSSNDAYLEIDDSQTFILESGG